MEIFVSCTPPKSTAQASMRIMKRKDGTQFVGKFANSKGKQVQNDLMTLFYHHRPEVAYEGAIKVSILWIYPWRKSESKKAKLAGLKPCTTRPDADNLCKLFFDTLTRLSYWSDDSIIADLRFRKYWGDTPGIGLSVEEITTVEIPTIIEEEVDPF